MIANWFADFAIAAWFVVDWFVDYKSTILVLISWSLAVKSTCKAWIWFWIAAWESNSKLASFSKICWTFARIN